MSSPFAGALMMTFLAPAERCALAFSASVKMPVDSTTTSTPRSRHGQGRRVLHLEAADDPAVDDDRVARMLDDAVVRAVRRIVLEQQGVHVGRDEIVDGDDLDIGRALDERLEGLATDSAEAVDADADCHRGGTSGCARGEAADRDGIARG